MTRPQCQSVIGLLVYWLVVHDQTGHTTPQAPDRFNPKVRVQTCGIIQKLYETKHIETMMFVKSVIALISKIEPKTSKKDMKNG